jgi:hypothetical protein
MRLWRIAVVVLLCLVAGFVSTAGGLGLRPTASTDQVTHNDGSTCLDSDHGREPCGPMCPCTCCPGHGTVATPFASGELAVISLAPPVHEVEASRPQDLHPKELLFSIFHPPRA